MTVKIPDKYKIWIEARKRFKLSHKHIQMARELGMNPKKFGSLGHHKQQPWKAPLAEFIASCYLKRWGKEEPDNILSIEQIVKNKKIKKDAKKRLKANCNE